MKPTAINGLPAAGLFEQPPQPTVRALQGCLNPKTPIVRPVRCSVRKGQPDEINNCHDGDW